MKRAINSFLGRAAQFPTVAICLFTLLFFLFHYSVFFNGHYRSHGDFTSIHFAVNYILNSVLLDFDIPVWQPYQGLGSVDILSYLAYHPLIAAISAVTQAAASVFPGSGYSFFKTTFFSFLLGYCLTFAFGCYLLAKDFLKDKFASLAVFVMALFGTHIYFTVYSLTPGVYYLPFIPLFLFRLLSGERLALNLAGLIISLGLFISSNGGYFGQASTMLILLLATTALLRPWDLSTFRARFIELRNSPKQILLIMAAATLSAGMLALKALLTLRLPDFVSAHRALAPESSYIANNTSYLASVTVNFFTNHIASLLENLVNNGVGSPLQEYRAYPRLYYGLFPVLLFLFFWRRIKNPVLPVLLSLTLALFLASTNPKDGYNFILPLMVYINPLLSMSTRHLNFPVIFAAPFLILIFGLALDALLRSKAEEAADKPVPYPLIAACLLAIFAAARFVAASPFPRYCAFVVPVALLIIYFPSRRFPKLRMFPGILALALVFAELFIPFRQYTKDFYEPFGEEKAKVARFGPNLNGPKLRGFPAPFRHSFSFWFDDKGLITTAECYSAQNNAAFKFFSGAKPELLNLPGLFLEDMPYLRGKAERLFFVDSIIPARNQEESTSLTEAAYKKGLHRTAAVVETLGEDPGLPAFKIEGISIHPEAGRPAVTPPGIKPVEGSAALAAAAFTMIGTDGKNPSVRLYRAKLPESFPQYLTSNFLNKDVNDIEVTSAGSAAYAPTYFDVFNGERLFQANYRVSGGITISGPPPAEGLTLKWKDRLGSLGITVKQFGYNSAEFEVTRKSGGFLVYMDKFHPRWLAYIDGKPARIYRTNGQFKGLFVPDGSHNIKFRFQDPGFKLALLIATLAHLVGIVALFILCSIGTRPAQKPA